MNRTIKRLRNTDRRRLAIVITLAVVFGSLNWGLANLFGLIIDSNPDYTGPREAATSGYFIGFLASFAVVDLMRRASKVLNDRFGRRAAVVNDSHAQL